MLSALTSAQKRRTIDGTLLKTICFYIRSQPWSATCITALVMLRKHVFPFRKHQFNVSVACYYRRNHF